VRRDEDRAPVGGEAAHQLADPADALRVEAVRGLVQDQRVRIAEQRRRDAEALSHAEREAAGAPARDLGEPDELDQLVDPAAADAVRPREREQVAVGGAAGMDRAGLEHRPDLGQRRLQLGEAPAADRRAAGRRPVEPEDQPHHGRLARAVRAEEARDDAGPDGERDVVERELRAVPLRDAVHLDHRAPFAVAAVASPVVRGRHERSLRRVGVRGPGSHADGRPRRWHERIAGRVASGTPPAAANVIAHAFGARAH
jgi:hypothetical protein